VIQVSPPQLAGPRLNLELLQTEHAIERAPVLDDVRLHVFMGGEPTSEERLLERYRRQAVGGPPDGSQRWLNWVVRLCDDERAVGYVQATVAEERDGPVAEVAWVVAIEDQGQGYAREAAQVMVQWLREQGVTAVRAHVHPDHGASCAVAQAVGLAKTPVVIEGEHRWQG